METIMMMIGTLILAGLLVCVTAYFAWHDRVVSTGDGLASVSQIELRNLGISPEAVAFFEYVHSNEAAPEVSILRYNLNEAFENSNDIGMAAEAIAFASAPFSDQTFRDAFHRLKKDHQPSQAVLHILQMTVKQFNADVNRFVGAND